VKTEADSNDISEHPHDDKSRLYMFTVSRMVYMGSEFDYTLKRHTAEKCIHVTSMGNLFMSEQPVHSYGDIQKISTGLQNMAHVLQ